MKGYFPFFLASIWLAVVSAGVSALWAYDYTPGGDAGVPSSWPSGSKIAPDAKQPTLIMFAHPKCPCTRASLGELMVLMTHCQGRVNARVVFFQPKPGEADWLNTDLWRSAKAIPGVSVQADEDGAEAASFHITTSGHVVLYDVRGKLLFSGGITSSRGHAGDNAGSADLLQLLHHDLPTETATPVFGCSLLNTKSDGKAKDTPSIHCLRI
jgi:hypothetical protein